MQYTCPIDLPNSLPLFWAIFCIPIVYHGNQKPVRQIHSGLGMQPPKQVLEDIKQDYLPLNKQETWMRSYHQLFEVSAN